jgi:hypothetical protein
MSTNKMKAKNTPKKLRDIIHAEAVIRRKAIIGTYSYSSMIYPSMYISALPNYSTSSDEME